MRAMIVPDTLACVRMYLVCVANDSGGESALRDIVAIVEEPLPSLVHAQSIVSSCTQVHSTTLSSIHNVPVP